MHGESHEECLSYRNAVAGLLETSPYCLPLHAQLALHYFYMQYPDLAIGSAYKALLLSDALLDESDEYYEQAHSALEEFFSSQIGDFEAMGGIDAHNAAAAVRMASQSDQFVGRICLTIV